ncbi:MAG: DEAD/DEAH box helicase family protein, partial [Bdellovibrionales bacterium]
MGAKKQSYTYSLKPVLKEIKDSSKSSTEDGSKFEKLMKEALQIDPSIAGKFDEVCLWSEWKYNNNEIDTGIDLVGVDSQTKEYVAIQCKFFKEDNFLKDISTFISKANTTFKVNGKQKCFSKMILITTTDNLSKHAEDHFNNQKIPHSIISLYDLENSKIDWEDLELKQTLSLKAQKTPKNYQKDAIESVVKAFKTEDRGKLIMACGTGKTFTSLKLMEKLNKEGDFVLFLVPSIALMSQTIREWIQQSSKELNHFAVCSDKKVGKGEEDISINDFPYSATTNLKELKEYFNKTNLKKSINIVFSTYQSIDVIIEAQKKKVIPKFNLAICDEAHRTTGFHLKNEQTHFTKIHNKISCNKTLYMTATPRIYKVRDKDKIESRGGDYYSMDDERIYGRELFKYGFSQAVKDGNLSDYKVMVLAIPESIVNSNMQGSLSNEDRELEVSDEAKILGCFQGLQMKTISDKSNASKNIKMKRSVAFCGTIKESKKLSENFKEVTKDKDDLVCETDHIDGGMNAGKRGSKISWLKEEFKEGECRILFNAKCLSEGVDVPSLDSVIFLNPKNSEVDVVQSVGRVMRKSDNKKYGYIIIPVVIPQNEKPSEALNDNKKYKVIWQVIQALRSHDDSLKHEVAKIEFGQSSKKINVIGITSENNPEDLKGDTQISFDLTNWEDCIYAKMVSKCGDRMYWDDWASDVTKVASSHVQKINDLIKKDKKRQKQFKEFTTALQKILNPSISEKDAIELVSQHIITKPIFKALFPKSKSIKENPISQALEKVLVGLEEQINQDMKSLNQIYMAIGDRAKGIKEMKDKQEIIKELYSKFFQKAFPKKSDKLGIVYTPIEAIDFMIHSTEHILNKDLNESLNDKGLKILEPFSGSGTFVTKLLESGLIKKENLVHKYKEDIFANEILLLAHYISQVNIEEIFCNYTGSDASFEGGTLTDTFQIYEDNSNKKQDLFPATYQKIEKQKQTKFKVIIGNPPYNSSQKSANDNNQNEEYKNLHKKINETYVANSKNVQNTNYNYDTYLKAIRLASDKLSDKGVISFITNASFLNGSSLNGVRISLEKEFDKIYILNLRGNSNTKGKIRQKEAGNLFDQNSKTPIAIFFLVKNKDSKKDKAEIYYSEVPDYLSKKEKLNLLKRYKSIENIKFKQIQMDEHGDWLNQRDDSFYSHLEIANNKDKLSKTLFDIQSCGVKTHR